MFMGKLSSLQDIKAVYLDVTNWLTALKSVKDKHRSNEHKWATH